METITQGGKYNSVHAHCLSGKINDATNDDLCAQRDRIINLVSDVNITDVKSYRKMVDALKKAAHTIEMIKERESK
jgi:hypothetical protein